MPATAHKARNAASYVWLLLCYAASVAGTFAWGRTFVDSDAASELILARTLLDQGGGLLTNRWLYSTELRVINTQLVYELGLALFPGNWHMARTFSVAVFLLLILAATWFLFRSLDIWNHRTRWIAGALLLPFSAIYREFYLMLSYYVPHLCMTFVAFGLYTRVTQKRSGKAAIAGLLVAIVAGLNGARLILSCYVPLLLATGVQMLVVWRHDVDKDLAATVSSESPTATSPTSPVSPTATLPTVHLSLAARLIKPIWHAVCLLIAAGIGYLVNNFVLARFFEFFDTATMETEFIADPMVWLRYIRSSCEQMWGLQPQTSGTWLATIRGPLSQLLFFIMLAALVYCAVLWFRNRLSWGQGVLLGVLVIGIVINSLAFWFVGRLAERYLSLCTILAFPLLAIVLEHLGQPRLRLGILVVCMACLVVQSADDFAIQRERSVDPPKFAQVADWAQERGYTNGLGTFWNANVVTEMSDGALEMWAYPYGVWEEAWSSEPELDPWLQLASHMTNPPEGPVFFVTTEEELAQPGLAKLTQEPALAVQEVRVYEFDSYDDFLHYVM